MKTIKIILLVIIFSLILTTAESFAFPRHIVKVYNVFPRHRVVKVIVVKRPTVIIIKKHPRRHRRIIYYY